MELANMASSFSNRPRTRRKPLRCRKGPFGPVSSAIAPGVLAPATRLQRVRQYDGIDSKIQDELVRFLTFVDTILDHARARWRRGQGATAGRWAPRKTSAAFCPGGPRWSLPVPLMAGLRYPGHVRGWSNGDVCPRGLEDPACGRSSRRGGVRRGCRATRARSRAGGSGRAKRGGERPARTPGPQGKGVPALRSSPGPSVRA